MTYSPDTVDLPANPRRAAIGAVALCCMAAGAFMLWGLGGALFVGGLFAAVDLSVDEAVERFTRTTRGKT